MYVQEVVQTISALYPTVCDFVTHLPGRMSFCSRLPSHRLILRYLITVEGKDETWGHLFLMEYFITDLVYSSIFDCGAQHVCS